MKAVSYQEAEHYELICSWWTVHKWPQIPSNHLPKTGFVIYDLANEPIIAGFVYKTDSAFGLFEFIVSNPNKHGLIRDMALEQLTSAVVKYSKGAGIKSLFSSVINPSLIKKLVSNGFQVTDTSMTNLIRRIE